MLTEAEVGMCYGRSNFAICIDRAGLEGQLTAKGQYKGNERKITKETVYLWRHFAQVTLSVAQPSIRPGILHITPPCPLIQCQ